MLNLPSAGFVSQALPCRTQSSDDPALVANDMEYRQPAALQVTRPARAESTGRKRRALNLAGLGLTRAMTRALGILTRHVRDVGRTVMRR
jgi:hypothetical protein